jgi:hypothetical protein
VTAAKIIEANHKEFICIERLAWSNEVIPPTRIFIVFAVPTRHMMMARKRMADQHRIRLIGI